MTTWHQGYAPLGGVLPSALVASLPVVVLLGLLAFFRYGPWLVDIAGAIVSLLSLVTLLRFWQPRAVWRFAYERANAADGGRGFSADNGSSPNRRQALVAWAPWLLLSVLVFAWGTPQVRRFWDGVSIVRVSVPALDCSPPRQTRRAA